MKKTIVLFGTALALSFVAFAELPESTGTPKLEFKEIPLQGKMPRAEHKVTPYRLYNKMIVTVWDPVSCGQKAIDPKFSITGNTLALSYSLTPGTPGAKECSLVSEFDVSNLPHRDLEVAFAGGPEPYIVVKLKKCPNYKPTSEDIYECLAPVVH